MKIDNVRPALLKISSGKCVCIQTCSPNQSHQLVAENLQGNDPGDVGKVTVYDILYNGASKCMAFCFELGDKAIFPVVTDGKDVKFEELPKQKFTEDTFKEKFLFQWGEAGSDDWRSLKSVAKPSMYLFVEDDKNKMARVTINPVGMPYFKIDEKNETETEADVQMNRKPRKLSMRTSSCRVSLVNRDSNKRPSCRAATARSTKPKCCPKRKTKKMKTCVKS